jgi:hypothetical protein
MQAFALNRVFFVETPTMEKVINIVKTNVLYKKIIWQTLEAEIHTYLIKKL